MGYIGSLNNEGLDASTIAEWGVEYLTYDNCYADGVSGKTRVSRMSLALNDTNHGGYGEIYYNVNNWGNDNITEWGPGIVDSWSTSIPMGVSN